MLDLHFALAVVAQVVVVVEIALYFGMPVAWMSRLPFRHQLEIPLKPGNLEAATRGTTGGGSWRYLPAHRMLVFRRALGIGSRAYVLGSIRFTSEGTEVRWAPIGVFVLPILCVKALFMVGQADMGPIGLVLPVFFPVFAGVYWVFCRHQIRTGLAPEVELAWLDHQRGL